jgi:hypothetical protein
VTGQDSPTASTSDSHSRALVAADDHYIHSDIFQKLVKSSNDIPGLVAYGIYQIRKREWIEKYENTHRHPPGRDEVKNYSFGWGDGALNSLRGEAEADMFRFTEKIMAKKIEEMKSTAFNVRAINEVDDLKKLMRRCGSYRHHIVGHVIGFGVLVVIVAVLALVWAHEPSLREVINWFFRPQ